MNQQLKLLIQLFTTALTARARHTDSIGHRQDIPARITISLTRLSVSAAPVSGRHGQTD
jgi:hypothetical protein